MAPTAPWSFRAALLPLPLLALVALLRRSDRIDLVPSYLIIALAWGLAAAAILLGVLAFARIWRSGHLGFGSALAGSILGLIVLVVPAAALVEMARLPRLADISTDTQDPPDLGIAPGVEPRAPLDIGEQAEQLAAYPDIVPRHYPLSPERVFEAVSSLTADRGWKITARRPPDADNALGEIEAEAHTLAFAFPVDVAIRLEADEDGTLVDMRSASRIGAHDLGDNARRIRSFLGDLDQALQGVTETTGTEGDADAPPPPPLPQAPPPH